MKYTTVFFIAVTLLASCTGNSNQPESGPQQILIVGTWKLLTETTVQEGKTTVVDHTNGQEQLKIINDTHFSFLSHDLSKGKDSTKIFVAGGGSYKLNGDKYTENLQYCNYREWEGNTFNFTVSIQNDTLVQRGIEKIAGTQTDRQIIEKYVRLNTLSSPPTR